jgi:hypothetical protein
MAARESPRTLEEETEGEPQFSSEGAHEIVQRPCWRRMIGR